MEEEPPPPHDRPPPRCSRQGPGICWDDPKGEVWRLPAPQSPREGELSCFPSPHQPSSARTGKYKNISIRAGQDSFYHLSCSVGEIFIMDHLGSVTCSNTTTVQILFYKNWRIFKYFKMHTGSGWDTQIYIPGLGPYCYHPINLSAEIF